jgi:hypothetical protein
MEVTIQSSLIRFSTVSHCRETLPIRRSKRRFDEGGSRVRRHLLGAF